MIAEIGHFALVLACAVALAQTVLPLWGWFVRDESLSATAMPAALCGFLLTALSFAALTHAHIVNDFSLATVFENSHSLKPLIYKISGVWGNHEGSMLLWVLILALFGALVAVFARALPISLQGNVLAMQGLLSLAFLLFILFTSNPFARLAQTPFEGRDLNPVLQDIGLAIHPPLLYVGYVGFSIVFSFAAAALISGRVDAAFARYVRPWILLAWIFLTLGIAMGSYWAYYTLGWGGFWFWDPVENASLMPWLAGTALVHSAIGMEKREALTIWTLFLAILTFSLSLLGTFLVRSGVLTSVHAFASDPTRGVFILAILIFVIGGALALYAWRAPALKQGGLFAPMSREGALVLNNLFLTAACATVFTGTLYPLALETLTGDKITVGTPFYALTFVPLAAPLALLMPLGQALAWKRGDFSAALQRLLFAAAAGLVVLALVFGLARGGPVLAPIAIGAAAYLIVGSLADLGARAFKRGQPLAVSVSRALGLPRAAFGAALAHAGLGVTVIGLAASAWGVEHIVSVKPGEPVEAGPYAVSFEPSASRQVENYTETFVHAHIRIGGNEVASIDPSKRFFAARKMQTTRAGIETLGFGQIYVSIGDQNADGTLAVRVYWKPLVTLIWIGAIIMALGGALSLSDRRLRVGAPGRAAPAVRAQMPVAAE